MPPANCAGRASAWLIAHPERALAAAPEAWPLIEHELSRGAGVQVNAWSLLGRHGHQVRDLAAEIIGRSDLVVLASDAHNLRRPPSLRPGLAALRSLGHAQAGWCVEKTPRSLLEHGLPVTPSAAAA